MLAISSTLRAPLRLRQLMIISNDSCLCVFRYVCVFVLAWMCAWCALHGCVHDVQTFTFASISPYLLSVHVSMTGHDKSTLNFFIRHTAIWHKFNEKPLMIDVLDTVYGCMQTFTFASISPDLLSVHVSMTVHDKSTLNFFIRHTAIRHIYKFMQTFIFAHICRPSLLPQFLHICWLSRCPWLSRTSQLLIFSVGTQQFGTFMNF